MKKKLIRHLSTLALSVIVGVSAFGTLAHAAEYSTLSLNSVACPWCGSIDVDDLGSSIMDYSYVNPDSHSVTVRLEYQCNPCHTEFNEYETYYEGHDYDFIEATGEMVCGDCGDSY